MKGIKAAFILMGMVLSLGTGWADQQGGQRPAAYLEMGVGGMQDAMGGAAVGVRNDVACGFWNPAGLTALRGFQVEDQYTLLSLNQQLNYLGLANNFRDKFFYGVSWIYYSAGNDIEARTGPSLNPDSIFSDSEMTFIASMAFRLDPRWALGINLKVLTQSIGSFSSAFGFGEDIGLQYRLSRDTTFGFVIQDIYTSLTYNSPTAASSTDPEQIVPTTFKFGVAHHQENWNLKAAGDLDWSQDLGFEPHLGLEWRPLTAIALRGGVWAENILAGAAGGSLLVYFTTGVAVLVPVENNLIEFDYSMLEDRINPGALINQIAITGKFL
ncbi:MAG TPA: PorV/PorQ family protein [bacterium]|jgi:hypothetical protein|nr:PorV/PorQ family protein [bacterium]